MSFSFYGGGNNGFWEGVGFTLSCPLEIVGNDSLWTNTTHWTQANISLDIPFRLAITSDIMITLTPSFFGVIGYYPLNTVGISGGLGATFYSGQAGISTSIGYKYYYAYFANTWYGSIGLVIR